MAQHLAAAYQISEKLKRKYLWHPPGIVSLEFDPNAKHRRSGQNFITQLRSLAESLNGGKELDAKRVWGLVALIVIVLFSIFNVVHPHIETNPYLAAATWKIPRSAPKVQRTAQIALQQFCKTMYRDRLTPPHYIELEWSPSSTTTAPDLAKMKLAVADRPEIPVQDEYDTNYREFTFGVDGPPSTGSSTTLMKVDGISSMDANHDPYSIYVSIPRGSTGGDIVSNELMMRKGWEELAVFTQIGQLDALARELNLPRSEIYFIDIGANLGSFTLGVAAAGFSVIAIEAMSVNQFALSMSLCTNMEMKMAQAVTLLPVALGRDAATCGVYSHADNVLDGTIRCGEKGEEEMMAAEYMVKRQDVQIARLDDLLKSWIPALKNRVGGLKIDTEGFEPWVIEGAQNFLSTVRPRFIQLEASTMSEAATNVSAVELLTGIVELGYELRETAFSQEIQPSVVAEKISKGQNPTDVFLFSKQHDGAAAGVKGKGRRQLMR